MEREGSTETMVASGRWKMCTGFSPVKGDGCNNKTKDLVEFVSETTSIDAVPPGGAQGPGETGWEPR